MTRVNKVIARIAFALAALSIVGCNVQLNVADAARSSLSSFLTGLASTAIDGAVNPHK